MRILWIVRQDLSCSVFLIRRLHRLFLRPDFLELTFSRSSVKSTALQLKFAFVTSFLFLGQLRDLPQAKKKWLLNLWNFKFYEDLLVNSVHLSSAKLIRPHSWLIVLSFWFRISILKTLFLGFFLIDRMCLKLKDWWSICQSYSFSCFHSWKAAGVYRGYFATICWLC